MEQKPTSGGCGRPEGRDSAQRVAYTGSGRHHNNPGTGSATRPASGRPRPQSGVPGRPLSGRSARPLSGRSASVYTGEDDLEQLRQKYMLLEGDRRAHFETSQWTMQQNRETVLMLKKENRELKKHLVDIGGKKDTKMTPAEKEIRVLEKKVHELRSTYDKLVKERSQSTAKLCRLKERQQGLEKDKSSLMQTDGPELRTIRSLENRLDKALVKQNEAASISKTYESIISRLREERVTFDSQLRAVEDTLKAKTGDLEVLNNMAAEAQQAKEQAMADLKAMEAVVERERAHRQRELAERRAEVEAAEAQRAGGDAEELQRSRSAAASYDEAFRLVQEATGLVGIDEFVERFLAQASVRQDLKTMESEMHFAIDVLNQTLAELQPQIEELRYIGTGTVSSREEVDGLYDSISEANGEEKRAKAEQDRLGKQMVTVKAGLAHLQDMLQDLPNKGRKTLSTSSHNVELMDDLLECGDKMAYAMELCGRNPHALQALAQLHDDPSCFYDPSSLSPLQAESPVMSPKGHSQRSEEADEVIGVGASMSYGDGLSTAGITKSVVIDRNNLKLASSRKIEAEQCL
eukprot:CAMPEP_0117668566 /NCGR_PEP_ID=MMETSP0804-20121206/11623_1 /TAXON_ID=1074897 /ORGANISM="Tetraselmis astigmatica, Strain CCMP880" /LENGTH=576 /DNA_ID=CAMNT_0005476477 /DNA_START=100 /DNA_END=1830 /DNA_ORIENTATION=+